MSDLENLYNSPETQVVPEQRQVNGNITEPMHRFLKETSPWMRFIGIVGFISSGGLVVFGLISILFTTASFNFLSEETVSAPFWLVSLIYIATGAVLFFPSYFTYKAGTMIRRFILSNTEKDLEEALKNNKALWKFYGIITIISLSFIPILIAVSVIIAVTAVGLF